MYGRKIKKSAFLVNLYFPISFLQVAPNWNFLTLPFDLYKFYLISS